jgi:hypothetical protein
VSRGIRAVPPARSCSKAVSRVSVSWSSTVREIAGVKVKAWPECAESWKVTSRPAILAWAWRTVSSGARRTLVTVESGKSAT